MLNQDHKIERNLGEQPIKQIMQKHNLRSHDLVEVSTEQISHHMVTRASNGRRLTQNVKSKVLNALNKASNRAYTLKDLFNY